MHTNVQIHACTHTDAYAFSYASMCFLKVLIQGQVYGKIDFEGEACPASPTFNLGKGSLPWPSPEHRKYEGEKTEGDL